ncbi:MAG TPA: lipoprotein-releasing system ATP-binding protein LolD, partial [Gammaproteobacteria bacterium]|nr:lipoprotein-releasing system ATP-binding protein LolD [Gammaproteobacteria bacterium]
MSNPVIACDAVKIRFADAGDQLEVLHGINLDVHTGDFVSIVGNSGSGKSTLLHILAGLEQPSEGEVSILGTALSPLNKTQRALLRRQHLGFIYQLHHLLPEFTALENVAMPLMLNGMTRKQACEAAQHWLEKVKVGHRVKHRPSALSGGERQRVAIARALVTNPACVLADE